MKATMILADYAVVSDGKLTIVGGGWLQTGGCPRRAGGGTGDAEEFFGEALTLARAGDTKAWEIEPLERMTAFLRERRREDDAAPYVARLAALSLPPRARRGSPDSTARPATAPSPTTRQVASRLVSASVPGSPSHEAERRVSPALAGGR